MFVLRSAEKESYEQALATQGGVPCVQDEATRNSKAEAESLKARAEALAPNLVFDLQEIGGTDEFTADWLLEK